MVHILSATKLQDISLFQGLSPRAWRGLKAKLKEKTFVKGDFLFLEGRACEEIIIVQSGRVKVFRTSAAGREQILEVLEPGDTCACHPGTANWSCTNAAQALTPCRVWVLSRRDYLQLVKDDAQLMQALNQLFAQKICRFCSLIEEVALDDPKRRLVKFLINLSGQRRSAGNGHLSPMALTHEEISQRLGLARETVTRQLNQLKRSKLIDIQSRRIMVRDEAGLRKILADPA